MALLEPGQEPPALKPLANSHDASQLEAEMKALFMEVFEDLLRESERRINLFGSPHLGDFELLERNIKRDGLALYRNPDEGAMRYLYKAWRARNPRRGLHFLRAYLQLLFPNNWTLTQMWQRKDLPYPTALSTTDGGNHFLTSRLRLEFETGQEVEAVIAVVSALRSAMAARFVLSVSIAAGDAGENTFGIANGSAGLLHGRFTGTL